MRKIIQNYSRFLSRVSSDYDRAIANNNARCRRGCHACCSTGLFAVTVLDALVVRAGLDRLSARTRTIVAGRANEALDTLEKKGVFSRESPLLTSASHADSLARRSAGIRCPLLDVRNRCVLYAERPLICRFFGPVVRGERRRKAVEGCGRFIGEVSERDFPVSGIFRKEDDLLRALYRRLGRARLRNYETIIPAAVTLELQLRIQNYEL